ncbi:MAG: diacylglycerol kinase family lipid kinase [Anaerolineales bacterium]|nr:diacylglycerol kinase family lipid kinase [Anaerolineales bacterium]
MGKHKAIIIVNPNADLGRARIKAALLRSIVDELGGADWIGTVYPSHAIEITRRAIEDDYSLIIAGGGDGTTHEVINAFMQFPKEKRPKLGVIPLGSGNDFAHAIGMNPLPEMAVRQIFTGKIKQIDVGRMVDDHGRIEYWANAIGIGFDATVTIRSRKFTYLKGFLIYLMAVLQTILLNHEAPCFKIKTDCESLEEKLLLFVLCNGSREGGGFLVAPTAKPDDGVYQYTGIRQVSRLTMLRILPEVMKGTHGRLSQVIMGDFHKLEIESNLPMIIHVDGEIIAGFNSDIQWFSSEMIPGAIQAIV